MLYSWLKFLFEVDTARPRASDVGCTGQSGFVESRFRIFFGGVSGEIRMF